MNSENASSGSGSGAGTSERRPNPPAAPPPDAPPETLTESEYLAQQAQSAQMAMARAFQEIKTRLGQGANPALWAKEYPWITVGAAAVAGFAAAASLIPSKEEQALKRLAAIERAIHPPQPTPRHDHGNGDGEPQKGGGMLGTILHELIGVLRPALLSMVAGGMGSQQQADDPTAMNPQGDPSQSQ